MENKRNRVLLCLGSNWDKEKNMERAAEMLRAHFVFIQFSQPVYTEPIDCPLSTTFLNRVAVLYSEESPARIKDVLKDIECCIGRKPEDKSCGRVPIDIDLLQWNDQILKAEDLTREYVLDGICSPLPQERMMNGANRKPKEPLLRINALIPLHIKERTGLFRSAL